MLSFFRRSGPRPTPSRRKKLLRDALLLAAALLVLTAALDFPIPTAELARRAAERRGFFGPGEVVAVLDYPRPANIAQSIYDRYYIERWQEYYAWVGVRRDGLFWQPGRLDAVRNDPGLPLVPLVVSSGAESATLVVSNNPAIAAVELSFPAAVRNGSGGNAQGYSLVTFYADESTESCFLLTGSAGWSNHMEPDELRLRGYNAGGELIYESPTPASWAGDYGLNP